MKILLESGEELSPFIWYKNIYRTYSLSEKIMNNLETKDVTYGYNDLYLNRSFVFDPEMDLLKDYSSHILVFALFIILIILFYSIIVNLFLVQESKSIAEYSKLKSIGATNKDISKIIRLKIMYISQIPIVLGTLLSLGLIKILFLIINSVDKYFSGRKDLYSIYTHLDLKLDFRLILFVYILSFLIIYIGTKKPIKKLKKNSILNGLKGNIRDKKHKKHDLKYTGNIEKNLSKQFYKNSKYNFRFTGITFKIGFLLMVFIMVAITYYSMDKKYNRVNKYETYDIQGEYATLEPLDEDFIKEIKELKIEDLVNFRKEIVFLDFDPNIVSNKYKNTGSLSSLEEKIGSFDNMRVEIFGIEDEKFKELALERGLNPDDYVGNKAILLNTMGDDFNIPVSDMKDIKFLKDGVTELSLSEYENLIEVKGTKTRGYEFTLNVEDKIDTPLFDYTVMKHYLNVYMPKSQYIELFDNFLRIADLDQYEYISVKTDNIEEIQESINNTSIEYFKVDDYFLESKLDEKNLVKKRNIIGSVLAIFLSLFFVVVGFSNSYFSFYNLFLKRKDEFLLYKSIGMDKTLLESILEQERKKILFSFIFSMPFIVLAVTCISYDFFGQHHITINRIALCGVLISKFLLNYPEICLTVEVNSKMEEFFKKIEAEGIFLSSLKIIYNLYLGNEDGILDIVKEGTLYNRNNEFTDIISSLNVLIDDEFVSISDDIKLKWLEILFNRLCISSFEDSYNAIFKLSDIIDKLSNEYIDKLSKYIIILLEKSLVYIDIGIYDNNEEVISKIIYKKAISELVNTLYNKDYEFDGKLKELILEWKSICEDENEFIEVRKPWLE
ncbi:FtsX-like permease family protein [Anaerosalibacter bizertensis]|uniref:FtsX-like permease family protein n=1 Tax=Anaerosalibacter bizertensis TaxID=932217 RepID=UPI001C0EB81D|nr:FtsX-like permease family protein [Anaerosalibacter bizertensis]MBU5292638.1 FtsX-like permease family protein [Anaerosalibacter bizertensis]